KSDRRQRNDYFDIILTDRDKGICCGRKRDRGDRAEFTLLAVYSRHARTNLSGLARGDERGHHAGVVTATDETLEARQSHFQIHRALIWALGGHRIKSVCDRDNARLHRNLVTVQ